MDDLRVTIPLILRYLRGPRAEDHHGRLGLELEEHAEELVEVGLVDDVADPSGSVSEGWPRSTTRTDPEPERELGPDTKISSVSQGQKTV
jgi:hypothetical protein